MDPSKPEPLSAAPATGGNGSRQSSGRTRGMGAKSHEAATRVKDVAVSRVEEVRHAADDAKHRASERVRVIGSAIRSAADHLRANDERTIANYADRASERVDGFADFVETAEPATLIRRGENLARQNPLVFFGGTFLVGLTLGRLLRSGAQQSTSEPSFDPRAQTTDNGSYSEEEP